jgi:hypothetical protein
VAGAFADDGESSAIHEIRPFTLILMIVRALISHLVLIIIAHIFHLRITQSGELRKLGQNPPCVARIAAFDGPRAAYQAGLSGSPVARRP